MKWFRDLLARLTGRDDPKDETYFADLARHPTIACFDEPAEQRARRVQQIHDARVRQDFIEWADRQKQLHEILWMELWPDTDLTSVVPEGWRPLLEKLFLALHEAPDADQCDDLRLLGLTVDDGQIEIRVEGASAMQFGMIRLTSRLSKGTCARCGAPGRFEPPFSEPRCQIHGLSDSPVGRL